MQNCADSLTDTVATVVLLVAGFAHTLVGVVPKGNTLLRVSTWLSCRGVAWVIVI